MPDPITTAIATAVAGSAATSLTAEATRILKEITSRIQHKLHGDPRAPADAGDAIGALGDTGTLAARLDAAFRQEPAFATEITALWENYQRAAANTFTNNFNGDAHTSIAISEIKGDFNFNA